METDRTSKLIYQIDYSFLTSISTRFDLKKKKRILDDEDNFCSIETLKKVLECKVSLRI
jgi:hypothetical protein